MGTMTYEKRYRPPKFGEDAGYAAILDTGNPWQNLANAIVEQAANDYRNAIVYKQSHPDAPRIEHYVDENAVKTLRLSARRTSDESLYIARCKREDGYRDEATWEVANRIMDRVNRLKAVRNTADYRRYANAERNWTSCDSTIIDCERFFRGDWFKLLTRLDGPELINMLRKDVNCK